SRRGLPRLFARKQQFNLRHRPEGGEMGQAMKLALVSMIRDEADILPAFLEHASELFDMGFLLDHRSSDGSQKIMDDFCSGFSGWSYFKLDFPGRHQRDMSNIFMRRA